MSQIPASKPERQRSSSDDQYVTKDGPAPLEQGRLFTNFLSVSDGEERSFASASDGVLALADTSGVDAFAEQLVPRLHATAQWPMHATFYLPRLGRINVCASRQQGAWNIELAPEEERTRAWLADVRHSVQERLASDLGPSVNVQLAAL
ncbi:hypothetical protein PspS35_03685 [Pseudomonas sp. S35]|uniref:type III secretion system HrpP C-terminal domain-containing protein n=1 Tax=Pseudomonas sp. S35 TaxID=1573719 RepID=UPI00132F2074|nr:type III secretion system HrpP C-terminal domain-containing protein [Pseudomonas sp. S35]QHF42932.1 hypothetical protein PspS35_03685 [Pseudomonas sp. S35]